MDFVTFDIAKKLKERGFKLACIGHYEGDRFEYNTYDGYGINISYIARSYNDDDRFVEYIDVPVICQVLKWLREEHHIHFEIVGAAYGYNLIISDTPDKGGTDIYYSHAKYDGPNAGGTWDSFEDCVMYGIKYVLDNLI